MDKSPTSSKMRATTPMELETAVAAVPKLREANKTMRMLQLPWLAAEIIHKIALGPPRFCGSSLTSGLPHPQQPTISCPHFEPLSSAPTSMATVPPTPVHKWGPSRPSSKIPNTPAWASPSLTHLLSSLRPVPIFRVVMFSAERDREEKERRFESNSFLVVLFFFSYFWDIHFKVITRIMTYNIIPEHIRFLEISCNVWNIYINIFPYK